MTKTIVPRSRQGGNWQWGNNRVSQPDYSFFFFKSKTKDVLIMNEKYMRGMKNPPHNYKTFIKKRLNSITIQGDLYNMV